MNKKAIVWVGLFAIAVIALVGFGVVTTNQYQSSSAKISVTASFYPVYFFSQQIGGDKVNVVNITPAGAEPHDYEPTASDIVHIESSRMLVVSGAVEPWVASVTQNLDPQHTLVVTAAKDLTTRQLTEDGKTGVDPHVWLDPVLAQSMVQSILQGYEQIDPANTSYYQANAQALIAKLKDLDTAYRQGLADCQRKDIVTSHAAFGYLAVRYGLNQVPIAGLSPDAEPSEQQLASLAQFVKNNHVTYIFFESLASPKLSQTLAQETGAKTLELNPLEGLTSEELAAGKDYVTEMEQNLG